jgi:6-pyruvoyltetrahydropterin/6-carboxytetrahydropterin synthase
MYYLKKHFTFAGGHRLSKHEGRCFSLHGHNYDVWITVRSPKLNENDMVMDFSQLKDHVNVFIDEFDHCLLVNKCDSEMVEPFKKKGMRVMVIGDFDPTAERMAEQLYRGLKIMFTKTYNDIEVDQVEIFENPNSSAIYRED